MCLSRGKLQVFAKRWNKQGKGVVLPLPKKSKYEQQVAKPVIGRKSLNPLPSKVSTSNPWASTVFQKARMLSVNSNSAFQLDAALHLFIEQPSLVMWDSHALTLQLEQLMAALDLPAHALLHVVARQPLILSAMPYRLQKELQVIASHLGATRSQVLEAAVKQPAIMKVDPAAALAVCQTMAAVLEQPVSVVVGCVMLEPDLLRVQPSSLPLRVATLAQVLQLSPEEATVQVLASPQLLLPSTSAVLTNFQRLADLGLVDDQTLLAMCRACPQLLVTPSEHIRQSAAALGELLGSPEVSVRATEQTATDATKSQASHKCSSSESATTGAGDPHSSAAASSLAGSGSGTGSGSVTASTAINKLHVASSSGSTPAGSPSSHGQSTNCARPTVTASAVDSGAAATAAPSAQATAITADVGMLDATPSASGSSASSGSARSQGSTAPSRSDRTPEATSTSPHPHQRPRQPTLQSHIAAAPHIVLCSPAVLRERMHCLGRIMDSRTPAATARLAASDARYLSLDTAHIDNLLLDLEFQLSLPRSAALALAHTPCIFFDLRPVDVSAVMRVLQGWLTPDAAELHALMQGCPQLFAREPEEVASTVSALRAAASSGGRPEAKAEAVRAQCTRMPELLLHGRGSVLLLQALTDALRCPAGDVVPLVAKVARVAPSALDSGAAVEGLVRALSAVAQLGGVLALAVEGMLEVVMAMVPAVLRPGQAAAVQGNVEALAAVCAQQEPWREELQAISANRLASLLLSPADRTRRLGYLLHLNAASLVPCHQAVMTSETDFLRSFPGFQRWQEPSPLG